MRRTHSERLDSTLGRAASGQEKNETEDAADNLRQVIAPTPRMAMALRSGATAVFDVINELDRLVGTLLAKAAGADLAGDTARFMTTFRTTYLGGAE